MHEIFDLFWCRFEYRTNNKGNNALLEAIKRDMILFVECLIANKADASIADSDGQTIYEPLDTNNPEHEHWSRMLPARL